VRVLPKAVALTRYRGGVPFDDDRRPYWQRLYGLGTPWNKKAFDNYATLLLVLIGGIVVVGAVLYVAVLVTR